MEHCLTKKIFFHPPEDPLVKITEQNVFLRSVIRQKEQEIEQHRLNSTQTDFRDLNLIEEKSKVRKMSKRLNTTAPLYAFEEMEFTASLFFAENSVGRKILSSKIEFRRSFFRLTRFLTKNIGAEFTSCGKTGPRGPLLKDCLAFYTQNWTKNSQFFSSPREGYQHWTVPQTGTYEMTGNRFRLLFVLTINW